MKRIRSLMLAALFVGASSGLAAAKDFVVNPQAGLTASHRSDDPSDLSTSARVGYLFGGNLRFGGGKAYLAPGFYFQRANLQLTQKDTLTAGNLQDVVGVQSLHIPLVVGLNMSDNPTGSGVGFRLFAGPTANVITKVQPNDFGIAKGDFKSTNWGILGGAGLDISRVTVDVSYEASLSKVMENSDARQQSLRAAFGFKL